MEEKLMNILDNVQSGTVNHQKNIKLLENIYNSVQFEDFLELFLRVIQGVLQEDYNNPCFRLLLEFLAKFVGYIARVQTQQNVSELDDDPPTHPFLTAVIREVVRHHRLPIPECRYNACSFLSLTLLNIGDRMQMDSQICDFIQMAMLENIQDNKPAIRLQAVLALVRLQDPLNPECPVIRAYISCLKDSSPLVRREAVRRIAPNALTIPKLKDRTTDTDANVRSAAFTHVAEIGIRHFKIVHRQFILKAGFSENNRSVKKVFLEYLLPKWLTALKGEYIDFLTAIKLDAEESDILNTEELSKKIMEMFFQTEPLENLIKAIPLDENKVIPLNDMRTEITHYWNILTKYLRKSEEMDEYLETIIPELTSFCNYLEKFISIKFSKTMEDWEYLDFQYMLYHLFDMAESYDLSEEVGRRTLDNLLKKVLRNHRLQPRLHSKVVQIASKLASSMDSFTNEMCLIISDIREPLAEQEPSTDDMREKEFKLAELKVKLNILEGDLEDAIDEKDFQKAQVLKNEIDEYRRRMDALNKQPTQTEKVRVSKDDPETVCWCLDLLAAVLIHSELKILSPSMLTCREEFLKPLIQSKNVEIAWRVFKCLAAYCVFDKKMAEEHVKQLMVPIASYRVIPNFNKTVLIISISIITDLIRLHGTDLFVNEDDNNSTTTSIQTSTRRRLYNADEGDIETINHQMSVEVIVNVVLDMLDDESNDIRDAAIQAAAKLILNGFTINPMVMTRLILKWYNPMTQKNLQQKLGMIVKEYIEKVKEAKEIVAKSVVTIMTNIAEAPKTSPLAEVDMENVGRFLAAVSDNGTEGLVHVHRDLAHTLIREIASRPAEAVTPHLAKMLAVLNIFPDNSPPTKELIGQAELLLEREALDKGPKQYITKFIDKLNGKLSMTNSLLPSDTSNNETGEQSLTNTTKTTTVPRRLSSIIEDDDEIEIEAADNGGSRTVVKNNKDVPNKRRRINTNELSTERETDESRDISLENANNKNKDDEGQERHSDPVESVQKRSDPDVISPSISPDSQEQTINNLRKRTRSNNCLEVTVKSKKKRLESKRVTKIEGKMKKKSESIHGKNIEKSNDDEVEREDKTSSAGSSGEKEVEHNSNSSEKANGRPKNKKSNCKSSTKNNEKSGNKNLVSSQSSNSDLSENNGRSLRSNPINPDVIPDTRRIQDRKSEGSDKENASGPDSIVTSSDSSIRANKDHSRASSKQEHNCEKSKYTGKRNGLKQQANNVSTSSESITSDDSKKKRGRPRKKDKTHALTKSKTNTNSTSDRRILGGTLENTSRPLLRSSISESSLTTRSRSSSSMSSTPVVDRNITKNKANKDIQLKMKRGKLKKIAAKTKNILDSSLSASPNESRRVGSRSVSEPDLVSQNRLKPKKDGKNPAVNHKNNRTSKANQIVEKTRKKSKDPRKCLFLNNHRSSSQSSISDVDEPNKESLNGRGRRKGGKRLNNNRVGGKEVAIIANGAPKAMQNVTNTPQVKRKKDRVAKGKKVTEESIRVLSEELFDSSDQSLHTIIEPSEIQMSVLPDDSLVNNSRNALRHSRRVQVAISETTSDSESASSPIRKSSRKKICP